MEREPKIEWDQVNESFGTIDITNFHVTVKNGYEEFNGKVVVFVNREHRESVATQLEAVAAKLREAGK